MDSWNSRIRNIGCMSALRSGATPVGVPWVIVLNVADRVSLAAPSRSNWSAPGGEPFRTYNPSGNGSIRSVSLSLLGCRSPAISHRDGTLSRGRRGPDQTCPSFRMHHNHPMKFPVIAPFTLKACLAGRRVAQAGTVVPDLAAMIPSANVLVIVQMPPFGRWRRWRTLWWSLPPPSGGLFGILGDLRVRRGGIFF